MTLRQPNIERLLQLGLSGMAEALHEQHDIADIEQLGFDDRLAILIEREAGHRDHKSYLGHLRQAQLRMRADIQEVDCRAGRGIARTTLTQLATGDWIRQALNLIVEGQTGSGKIFLICALAHQACRQKRSVLYRRVPELVGELSRARDTGRHPRLMRRLAKVDLLLLDDRGLQGFSAEGRRDLLEIAEQRYGRKSIALASQIPVERWSKLIGEPTIADAILDRIVHNAYRIKLAGESQRKRNKPPPLNGGGGEAPPFGAGPPGHGPGARGGMLGEELAAAPHCEWSRVRLRSQLAGRWPAPASNHGRRHHRKTGREVPPRPIRSAADRGQMRQESRSRLYVLTCPVGPCDSRVMPQKQGVTFGTEPSPRRGGQVAWSIAHMWGAMSTRRPFRLRLRGRGVALRSISARFAMTWRRWIVF